MYYLGEEKEIKVASVRVIDYIRCDGCGNKIIPTRYISEPSVYIHIHTWHNDWGNDSIDSHEHGDYCQKCAKAFINKYFDQMQGSEEMRIEHRWLHCEEKYYDYKNDGYNKNAELSKNDNVIGGEK